MNLGLRFIKGNDEEPNFGIKIAIKLFIIEQYESVGHCDFVGRGKKREKGMHKKSKLVEVGIRLKVKATQTLRNREYTVNMQKRIGN